MLLVVLSALDAKTSSCMSRIASQARPGEHYNTLKEFMVKTF